MKLDIREIKPEDAKSLLNLFPHWEINIVKKRIEITLAGRHEKRFVAIANGEVAGHIKANFHWKPRRHLVELESLFVLEKLRRKGIGTALLQHTLNQMPKNVNIVTAKTSANNTISLKLQKNLGFEKFATLENGVDNAKEKCDLIYTKLKL